MLSPISIASLILSFTVAVSQAQELQVQWVEAINNIVKCNVYKNGWVTSSTGPCSDFMPPDTLAIGKQFSESGNIHTIRVITATRLESGQWFCGAAESADDLNMYGKQSQRVWLFIPKCIPVQ